jgi:hypothetical protein
MVSYHVLILRISASCCLAAAEFNIFFVFISRDLQQGTSLHIVTIVQAQDKFTSFLLFSERV